MLDTLDVKEMTGGAKSDAKTDFRIASINDAVANQNRKFVNNVVITSKYAGSADIVLPGMPGLRSEPF